MTTLRDFAAALLSKGVLSAGWDSALTGVALLVVGSVLGSVPLDQDRAAGFVGVAAFLAGAWMLQRGLRAEFTRGPRTRESEPRR